MQRKGKARRAGAEAKNHDEEVYAVEEIRDHRVRRGQLQYLIKWMNYGEEENTWEPSENVSDASIVEYWENRRG